MTTPETVDVAYRVPVIATIDPATRTITRVRIIDDEIVLDRDDTFESNPAHETDEIEAAIEIAESAEWPSWVLVP